MHRTILSTMGYNPYRKFQARPVDYALVVIAIVIAIALVAWAFLG
jgi:multisubunit Na+/H+ antiporter MnhC subunit